MLELVEVLELLLETIPELELVVLEPALELELVVEPMLELELDELDVVLELEPFEVRAMPATTAIIRIARTPPIITVLETACLLTFISKLETAALHLDLL
ncbi:MAG: hypothetical protein OK454_01160 [Thaumarchaeota archaeon]|nr:hypothetical protein [Nitrososphaerota archaeon]